MIKCQLINEKYLEKMEINVGPKEYECEMKLGKLLPLQIIIIFV